tara:strand:+ start:483 stop:728 length:246 start_codon:yes stop_codon:yes gene_type:complete
MSDPREQRRNDWIDLLEGVAYYHMKKCNETAPVLYMQEPSEEHTMHKVYCEAVKEAIGLIRMLPTAGPDEVLPQYDEGPAG